MIGVTIGIGDKHLGYAREAAARFKEYTGLKTVVMTEEYLKEVEKHKVFKLARNEHDRILFLKFFILNFFYDDVYYFDADYCVVDKIYPEKMYDGRFTAVRDRIHSLYDANIIASNVQNYFNAGMFIASPEHKNFFEQCIHLADKVDIKFGDQCILNSVAEWMQLNVNYISKLFNCLDFAGVMPDCNVLAVHNAMVYDHYAAGTKPQLTQKHFWDEHLMYSFSRKPNKTFVFNEKIQKPVTLLPDGLTTQGDVWFIDLKGDTYLCDKYVDNPRKVKYIHTNE